MAEKGIDISSHTSKRVDDLGGIEFDYVVTVCNNAHETCPLFPGKAKIVHVGFDDPPQLAEHLKNEDEKLSIVRTLHKRESFNLHFKTRNSYNDRIDVMSVLCLFVIQTDKQVSSATEAVS